MSTSTATLPAGIAGCAWRALGTTVHLLVTDPHRLETARRAVVATLVDVDLTYSRFRADSELRVLLADPGRDHLVSPLLARALGTALHAARRTDGAVDPTVGRALRLLGYDDDFERLAAAGGGHHDDAVGHDRGVAAVGAAGSSRPLRPLRHGGTPAKPPTALSVPGWRVIRFDPATRRVHIPAGVEVDLGATGKGLAADMAAEAALDAMDGAGVLVSLGGDIATDGTPPPDGWRVLVADDHRAPTDGGGELVRIDGGALATSSTTVRCWTRHGIRRHHLIDPATGLPAAGSWQTATVAAATCADANAAATAAIVMGDRAPDWLARHGLPARLVAEDGSVLRVAGWPKPPAAAQGRDRLSDTSAGREPRPAPAADSARAARSRRPAAAEPARLGSPA